MTTDHTKENHHRKLMKAFWMNYVPSIAGKDVLKLGSQSIDNLTNLACMLPRSLTCIGSAHGPLTIDAPLEVNYCSSLGEVSSLAYDIIVIDEEGCLDAYGSSEAWDGLMHNIAALLKEDGVLIIGGIKGLRNRFRISGALPRHGLIVRRHLLSNSLRDNPVYISSPFKNLKQAVNGLGMGPASGATPKQFLKYAARLLAFLLTSIYNPYRELLVIAARNERALNGNLLDSLRQEIGQSWPEMPEDPFVQCMVKDWTQFVFLYNPEALALVFIAKIYFAPLSRSHAVRREFESLVFLDKFRADLGQCGIETPVPVFIGQTPDGREYAVQRAVSGKPMDGVIDLYLKNNKRTLVMEALGSIYTVLESIHTTCRPSETTDKIDWREFATSLDNIPAYMPDAASWGELPVMQHGDFTTVNIFRDEDANKWGIIDWESLKQGYPPLFDLYCFFGSVRYTETRALSVDRFEFYYESLIFSYFRQNWFSEAVRRYTERYCLHFSLEKSRAFDYFLAYLTYHHNKFGLHDDYWPYKNVYERAIRYAVLHKDEFLGGISLT